MFSLKTWLNPIALSPERRLEFRREINNMSTPARSYFVLTVLSAAIASYGLLADSTAVVIGAMLVAPLMGPIFGIALSLISGAKRMLARAVFSEAIGAALVVLIGLAVVKFGPEMELSGEVLARTHPTILDIAIALASGLVGAFALVNDRINAALPGVAISVALVPPLASAGICLGAGEWSLAGGALVLFLANFLAIELAAALVFTVYGLRHERAGTGFRGFLSQFGWTTALLIVMSFFLYKALATTIEQNQLRAKVHNVLATLSTEIPGARLSNFTIDEQRAVMEVAAVFLTPSPFSSDSVRAIEQRLQQEVDEAIRLVVRSLISSDSDSQGPVYVPSEKLQAQAEAQRRAEYFTTLRNTISGYLAELPGAELANIFIPADAPETKVTALVNTPTALAPEQVAALQERLRGATGREVTLTVRSLLTVDADWEKYLYTPAKPPEPSFEQQQLLERLRAAFRNQLGRRLDGAYLFSITTDEADGRVNVRAIVRSPYPVTPAIVAAIESDVQEFVAPNIDLTVRTVLEADATSSGYRTGEPSG